MINTEDYVLVTAAHNEDKYIALTIESVIHQTILPIKWVIVSDGSTDHTDEIVEKYGKKYPFIELIKRENNERSFISYRMALKEGITRLCNLEFEYICILDADLTINSGEYFQKIIAIFKKNPQIGIAGGCIIEYRNSKPYKRIADMSSVTGAVQFFRRACFESTGGYDEGQAYSEFKLGGIDSLLEIKAKKNGWIVKTFPDLQIIHHRATGTANTNVLKARYKYGKLDYLLGNTLAFELLKCSYRIVEKPYFIGAVLIFAGYLNYCIKNQRRYLSLEEFRFKRNEQRKKVWKRIIKKIRGFGTFNG